MYNTNFRLNDRIRITKKAKSKSLVNLTGIIIGQVNDGSLATSLLKIRLDAPPVDYPHCLLGIAHLNDYEIELF